MKTYKTQSGSFIEPLTCSAHAAWQPTSSHSPDSCHLPIPASSFLIVICPCAQVDQKGRKKGIHSYARSTSTSNFVAVEKKHSMHETNPDNRPRAWVGHGQNAGIAQIQYECKRMDVMCFELGMFLLPATLHQSLNSGVRRSSGLPDLQLLPSRLQCPLA